MIRLAPALLLCLTTCGTADARTPVDVFAAASLRELLEGQAGSFEARYPGLDLRLAFAASSTHARQIGAGAAFDVFLSADADSVERVAARVAPETRTVFLVNRLALVAGDADGLVRSPHDLPAVEGPIAIAAPAVPAGRYARAWLAEAGILEALAPRFVEGRNVRAALAQVATGTTAYGFVYASDARITDRVRLVWQARAGESPRIEYVAGASLAAGEGARAFLAWLGEPGFREAARVAGFEAAEAR